MNPAEIIRQILAGIAAAQAAGVVCWPPTFVVIDGVVHAVPFTAGTNRTELVDD